MYRTLGSTHRVQIPQDANKAQALEAEGCKLVSEGMRQFYMCPTPAPERVYEVGNGAPPPPPVLNNGNGAPPPPPMLNNGNTLPPQPSEITVIEETFDASDEPMLDRALGWVQRHPFITIGLVGGTAVAVTAMRKPKMLPRTQNPAYLDPGFRTTYSRKTRRWTVQEEIGEKWVKIGEVISLMVGGKEKFVGQVKGGRKGRPVLSPHRAARFVVDNGRIE